MDFVLLFTIFLFLLAWVGLIGIFKKAGEPIWKAIIPVVNCWYWVRLVDKRWWWFVFCLVPAINIFMIMLLIVETLKAFNKYSFWHQLLSIIFPFVYLPYLGFNPKLSFTPPDQQIKVKRSKFLTGIEDLIWAVVAASIIRMFFIEAYTIPTPSMEKTLLVGDFLFVDKFTFGSRIPQTFLTIPLTHNSFLGGKSYWDFIRLPFYRYPRLKPIERYDIVVFNFPGGDTVWLNNPAATYYGLQIEVAVEMARQAGLSDSNYFQFLNQARLYLLQQSPIRVHPSDKRDNYVKRCVGLPGDVIQLKNQILYVNGQLIPDPENKEVNYALLFKEEDFPKIRMIKKMGVSQKDFSDGLRLAQYYNFSNAIVVPLTRDMYDQVVANMGSYLKEPPRPLFDSNKWDPRIFPHHPAYPWNKDNFGPLRIPKAGETVQLDTINIHLYKRIISIYEGNELQIRDGKIYINGQQTNTYTFKMDYYFMMGDNRHNSADSRFWGFVPEDHIVGRPLFIWLSLDKDKPLFGGKIRFRRMFSSAVR
ncbi:MAG: signal peptidase I [Bacteroidales bacterium]|nr:signal peptidase I [Bacteroidales bacterium]